MTTPALSIALICTEWAADASGGATFEDDVLRAVLSLPSPHTFVVYPDVPRTREAVRLAGASARVTLLRAIEEPSVPGRVARKVARVLRRGAPFRPFAELSELLANAGAQCAWMLGGSLAPVDLPYVATVWDIRYRTHPWFPEVSAEGEWRERERLTSELVRRAAVVLSGSEAGARSIREAFGDQSGAVRVVPMPTPAFASEASSLAKTQLPNGITEPFLLYPAQFWPHKNHVTAVRALAALGANDSTMLVLTGTDRGTRAHVLQLAGELGVAARIFAPGFVDRDTLTALYRRADALIHPSLFGPDTLPPLEAMALGCPVVMADGDGAWEHFGDAATYVDGLNPNAFASAILQLRRYPAEREQLIAAGRVRAAKQTPARYAAAVLALIDERIAPVRALWP